MKNTQPSSILKDVVLWFTKNCPHFIMWVVLFCPVIPLSILTILFPDWFLSHDPKMAKGGAVFMGMVVFVSYMVLPKPIFYIGKSIRKYYKDDIIHCEMMKKSDSYKRRKIYTDEP